MSVSDWSMLSASGDAAGEVEGVYLEKKKFSKSVSKALFIQRCSSVKTCIICLNFVRCQTAVALPIQPNFRFSRLQCKSERADQTEISRNKRTMFGRYPTFSSFKRLDWKFPLRLYEISIVLSWVVIIASSRTSFDLLMRLQVWNEWKKAFPFDLKRFQICNRKFWLYGKYPSLCLTTFILKFETNLHATRGRIFAFPPLEKLSKIPLLAGSVISKELLYIKNLPNFPKMNAIQTNENSFLNSPTVFENLLVQRFQIASHQRAHAPGVIKSH